jgi:putative hemolysin
MRLASALCFPGQRTVGGSMSSYDARERLALTELPEGEFNTFAGFMLSIFGRIPRVGERADWGGWSFEVAEIDKWHISAVRARRKIAEKESVGK